MDQEGERDDASTITRRTCHRIQGRLSAVKGCPQYVVVLLKWVLHSYFTGPSGFVLELGIDWFVGSKEGIERHKASIQKVVGFQRAEIRRWDTMGRTVGRW